MVLRQLFPVVRASLLLMGTERQHNLIAHWDKERKKPLGSRG